MSVFVVLGGDEKIMGITDGVVCCFETTTEAARWFFGVTSWEKCRVFLTSTQQCFYVVFQRCQVMPKGKVTDVEAFVRGQGTRRTMMHGRS